VHPPRGVRRWETLLLALVVASVALVVRWREPAPSRTAFHPRPDALEYAASAQAIAQAGEYYLQVGPLRVPPRYPPGWPMFSPARSASAFLRFSSGG
jgi:hypothetical protein